MADKNKDVGLGPSSAAASLRRLDQTTGGSSSCKPVSPHGCGPCAPIHCSGPQGAPHQQQVFPDPQDLVPIKIHSHLPVDQASGKMTEPVLAKPNEDTAPLSVRSQISAGGKVIEPAIARAEGAGETSNRKRSFEKGPGSTDARMIHHESDMKSKAEACEKKGADVSRQQLIIEHDVLRAQNKKLQKLENLYLELIIQVKHELNKSSEELDRFHKFLKRKYEEAKKLEKKKEELVLILETCEKNYQNYQMHRQLYKNLYGTVRKSQESYRLKIYNQALEKVSTLVAEGKVAEILLLHKKSGGEKDVYNCLDVSVPIESVERAIQISRTRGSSYVSFVKQLCRCTFKPESTKYFRVKGDLVRRSVFHTIALPVGIRKGFIGLAAHIGEQHKLLFPSKKKPISNSTEDEYEMRLILARRALDDWLYLTGERYLSKMLENMDPLDESDEEDDSSSSED